MEHTGATAAGSTRFRSRRLKSSASLRLKIRRRRSDWQLLVTQFTSPIILLLLAASLLSLFLHDPTDALIIFVIVVTTGVLGFWQERGANRSVETLLAMVQTTCRVLRGGTAKDIPSEETISGDILTLSAGDTIPGDCQVLESNNLYVDEAALTGETFPVAKSKGVLPLETPLSRRSNSLFMGTHVVSGTASAVVARIGRETEYGRVSERLKFRPPETEFEKGVRHFGYLLMEITLIMLIVIFAFNIFLRRQFLDSILFALALAVGMTPQLLPAIIGINLGVAYRELSGKDPVLPEMEAGMTFLGLLVLHDPPKPEIVETLREVNRLGIGVKMITGDNQLVAASVGEQIGFKKAQVLTGRQLRGMSDEALLRQAVDVDIFAEVEPNQKERIILALKKAGNVVGYLGDGINDATALHAADVGISVEGGADPAKSSADIVLLERNLEVLVKGVLEGRRTFANTQKYVFMASSANFGNMFSMAAASLFLPFLPLLPKQILLTNLITDFPEMTIATDNVDPQMLAAPRRWEVKTIRRFMLVFGSLSSAFDFLTFAALMLLLRASPEQFRTGWFVESIASATLIVLVIRSRASLFSPGRGRGSSVSWLSPCAIWSF